LANRFLGERNVPLKSFQLERLAVEFLTTCSYSLADIFYYYWMVRHFFAYLIGRANTGFFPGFNG